MSKLFNTLEQIRRHENFQFRRRSFSAPRPAGKAQGGRKWKVAAVLLLAVIALAAGGRLLLDFRLPTIAFLRMEPAAPATSGPPPADQPRATDPGRPATAGPRPHRPAPPNGSSREQQMISLNRRGVEAVSKEDYWQAVYFFKKASELQPGRPEPLINLGVALLKLELPAPARRAFAEAYAAAPADPRLRKNLELLAEAGLLEEALAAPFSTAQTGAVEAGG